MDTNLLIMDTNLLIMDTNLHIMDTNLRIKDTNLRIMDTNLLIMDTNLRIMDTNLRIMDTNLRIMDTNLLIMDRNLHIKNPNLHIKNSTLHMKGFHSLVSSYPPDRRPDETPNREEDLVERSDVLFAAHQIKLPTNEQKVEDCYGVWRIFCSNASIFPDFGYDWYFRLSLFKFLRK